MLIPKDLEAVVEAARKKFNEEQESLELPLEASESSEATFDVPDFVKAVNRKHWNEKDQRFSPLMHDERDEEAEEVKRLI